MADGVDATVDAMEAPGLHPALDGSAGEAYPQKLRERDHAVLASRDRGDQLIGAAVGAFWVHMTHKAPSDTDFAPDAPGCRLHTQLTAAAWAPLRSERDATHEPGPNRALARSEDPAGWSLR